ncbi:MAG: DUF5131 family protein [Chloroflexi bacterium]|nr:MAG: DUF5131 family protein [Chloroflexota bacterium]
MDKLLLTSITNSAQNCVNLPAQTLLQEWVTNIRDQCLKARVPFFFKQWGGVQKKSQFLERLAF